MQAIACFVTALTLLWIYALSFDKPRSLVTASKPLALMFDVASTSLCAPCVLLCICYLSCHDAKFHMACLPPAFLLAKNVILIGFCLQGTILASCLRNRCSGWFVVVDYRP
ncbi:hypothetical protein BC830DRAFT_1113570 [Chytriomyces sp. MP71]|nr:hypothetical protein BC830DRAFT_1113570 [Chytriomyces sp. MP71]